MDKIKTLEYNQIGLNESLIEHMQNPHLILKGPVSIQESKFICGLDSSRNFFLSFEVMASSTSLSYALGLISMKIQIL